MLLKFDRYILSEFCLPFLGSAGIITGVWLGIDKFRQVFKLLSQANAPIETGILVLGLEIPQILAITLPISILLASFLTFQKLSSLSEIIAMRAAGISFGRLNKPVLILGFLALVACFCLNEFIVPITNPLAKQIYNTILKTQDHKTIKGFSYFEKDSNFGTKRIFYARSSKKDLLRGVVILDFSNKNVSTIYTARKGTWDADQRGWVLYDGTSSYIKAYEKTSDEQNKAFHQINIFKKVLIPSNKNPSEILLNINDVKDMNFLELKNFIRKHEDAHITTDELNQYRTKYFNKYSYPFSCVLLAIIGACLGITGRRKAVNWGYIALGLIVFVFFMSQTIFDSFGQSGKIEPMLTSWLSNAILASITAGVYFYRSQK